MDTQPPKNKYMSLVEAKIFLASQETRIGEYVSLGEAKISLASPRDTYWRIRVSWRS